MTTSWNNFKLGHYLTWRRLVLAAIIAPVLFVLNVGPIIYLDVHGYSNKLVNALYRPMEDAIFRTPVVGPYYLAYVLWWVALAHKK